MMIRPEQMDALAKAARRRFDLNAAEYLRANYPENPVCENDPALSQFIDQGVAKAQSYAVTREVDVIRFLEVLLDIGIQFETAPHVGWVAHYLREPIRAELRLDYIVERLRFDPPPAP